MLIINLPACSAWIDVGTKGPLQYAIAASAIRHPARHTDLKESKFKCQ